MNPLSALGRPWSSMFGALLLGVALGGTGAWKVQNWRHDAELARMQTQADQQAARNRELQRAAELRYTVQAEAREKFIVTTVTEVRNAAQSLAVCPVPEPARRLLNAAAACADSAAACGADLQVREAK